MSISATVRSLFILFVHHKACHRDWLPELKYLELYEDKTFKVPETFYDDYQGRLAAQTQEMNIAKDMDMAYDVKVYRPGDKSRLSSTYHALVNRLDSADRARYNAFMIRLPKTFMPGI